MGLWNRLLMSCVAVLLLGLVAGAAHATSLGRPHGSGSSCDPVGWDDQQVGQLLFHDFRFHSPSCSVDPDDLTITFLEDEDGVGVQISGDITLTGPGWAKFYVSYEVTVVDPDVHALIDGASLLLDSSVHAPNAAVFAAKRVIGERPDKAEGHPWNDHGLGHLGWGHPREFEGYGNPDGKTLAFLRTAEWSMNTGHFCDLGWKDFCNGKIEFDEDSFAPQESVKVTDGVWIKGVGRDGSVQFFSSTNRFSVVPEPATAALLALGLFGLAIGGHRL